MPKPTIEEIQEQADSNGGWCTKCEAWTHDCCEPDAQEYECPECECNTVYGAEQLLFMGLVDEDDFQRGSDD